MLSLGILFQLGWHCFIFCLFFAHLVDSVLCLVCIFSIFSWHCSISGSHFAIYRLVLFCVSFCHGWLIYFPSWLALCACDMSIFNQCDSSVFDWHCVHVTCPYLTSVIHQYLVGTGLVLLGGVLAGTGLASVLPVPLELLLPWLPCCSAVRTGCCSVLPV